MSGRKEILTGASKALAQVAVKSNRHVSEKWDFANWLLQHVTVKRSGKTFAYSFKGYEPYLEIANNLHTCEENWFLKGTQIGFSTLMVGWGLYLPYWRGLDVGYALPDKVMIRPFMKTRFGKEQLNNNSVLKAAYKEHETDFFYDCGSHYVYFLGANVLSDTMTRPMECLLLDEVTIINKDQIELIEERLDAADFGQLNGFAREMYPGGPADAGFQSGRQNVYMYKCGACGHWFNLEECFYNSSLNHEPMPRCVAVSGVSSHVDSSFRLICEKCGKTLNRGESTASWVPKHPARDVNSYRLPQLIFPGLDFDRIMRRWKKSAAKKSKRAKLHASMLAIPDAGDLQRISLDTLKQLTRNYDMRALSSWSIGGMDMGDICYIVFADFVDDKMRLIWFQEINSDHVFEVASKLIRRINCMQFVIDGMPLTTEARKLAYEFPDIVVLNYYRGNELQEAEKDHLGQPYKIITQDREQALDDYCDLFTPGDPKLIFPARVIEDGREIAFEDSVFAAHHIRGSQKDEVEDNKLGKKIHKFKKHIPNHYFHAGNYMATAMALLSKAEGQFVGAVPIFGSFGR